MSYLLNSTLNARYVRVEGLKNCKILFQIWYICQQNGFQDPSPKDNKLYTLHNPRLVFLFIIDLPWHQQSMAKNATNQH
jgi:hypothetical protein